VKSVHLEMQGVHLQIDSSYEDLLDYVQMHLPDHITAAATPHVRIAVRWLEGDIDASAFCRFSSAIASGPAVALA